jgi:5-methylcytosine-specific restriction endonuclease McrA
MWGLRMAVFVVDCNGRPLMPCSEKHARKLLERGKAVLFRFSPFSIRLTHSSPDREILQDLTLKISPGSDTTGFALVRKEKDQTSVVFLAELVHRGWSISKTLWHRRGLRHRRRTSLRYRTPGPSNRHKPRGWIAPSILHRIETVTTWVRRFTKLAPITCIVAELSSYNGQELRVEAAIREDREQGQTRSELRRVVFATWGPKCAYCDIQGVPLELDHIVARSCGGSDRPYNRIPSCQRCNKDKGKLSIDEYLATDPERLQRIKETMKVSERDAGTLYNVRRGLRLALGSGFPPVKVSTLSTRQANLERLGIPSRPATNAACSGITEVLTGWKQPILRVECAGRGSYQRTGSYIPGRKSRDHRNRQIFSRQKRAHGFQTGDIVKAIVARGKKPGVYRGRAAVRASGDIDVDYGADKARTVYKNCRLIQRSDGYKYSVIKPLS